ncbi:MAG TPA: MFS transporter [Thermohalobaculum sp.]|nr:MFS transporter [Thermohalobaculum sp.]
MPQSGLLVLLAASLLSLILGSVHAFSVFLEPLEASFGASRSLVSLTYSLTLVSLTAAVLVGHRVFSRWPPARLVAAIGLLAAAGTLIAAFASSLPMVWLGYSLLFGAANGLGYGFGLQIAAQANPGGEGVCMGIVTACYALGAALSPAMFTWAMSLGGFRSAMLGLAATLIIAAPLAAGLMVKAGARFNAAPEDRSGRPAATRQIALLWLGYGAGVAAGLMAIGHAAGIAKSLGFAGPPWVAPVLIAVCNMGGSLSGGWLVDRIPVARLLGGLPMVSAAALLLLAGGGNGAVALFSLGAAGLTYGAIIAAYPATIAKIFGTAAGTRVYGRVFTVWGSAGLIAPWLAGYLFDRTGGYTVALGTAATLGIVSAAAVFWLFHSKSK